MVNKVKLGLIGLIILVICGLVAYNYYDHNKDVFKLNKDVNNTTKLPECIDGKDNDGDGLIDYGDLNTNDPDCSSPQDNWERDFTSIYWILGIIISIILSGGIVYLYVTHKKKDEEEDFFKDEVGAHRGWLLARSYFIDNYIDDIFCKPLSIEEPNIHVPCNKEDIREYDRLPRKDPATGEPFQFSFFNVRSGKMQGDHVLIYSLGKGEEHILKGVERVETNITRNSWKLLSRNHPMSSIKDKQDRMLLHLSDSMDDDELRNSLIKNSLNNNQSNQNSSPYANLDDDDFSEVMRMRAQETNKRKPKQPKKNLNGSAQVMANSYGDGDEQ